MTLQESYDYAVELAEHYVESLKEGSPTEDFITGRFLELVHFVNSGEKVWK